MKYTKNLNLNKPEGKDNYDIHALNENMDTLDTVLKEIMQKVTRIQKRFIFLLIGDSVGV